MARSRVSARGGAVMRRDMNVLVLEEDVMLGQVLCDMLRLHRVGSLQLATSEVDACQMMQAQSFDICILAAHMRGLPSAEAVAMANAQRLPVLLLTNGIEDTSGAVQPDHGIAVQKPAHEEDIRRALAELMQDA
ncbi:hypothetical protein MHM97_13100 [Epibacterium sp. Ofav1-8]|nr:hypothetical protein [Epibacterium sp. Ofav1-8]